MKSFYRKIFFVLLVAMALTNFYSCTKTTANSIDKRLKLNWQSEPVKYKHFVDLGNYFIKMNDADFSEFDSVIPNLEAKSDMFKPSCTAAIKKNDKGEVIVGRNMDIEISQNPACITRITGGKYDTITITYPGLEGKYKYSQLAEMDEDEAYLGMIPYASTDAMNETGLYAELNMREMDNNYNLYCMGTNPGKKRLGLISTASLVALNCSTVKEAVEFLKNSYDWYSEGLPAYGDGEHPALWNMAMIIGDSQGEYGLIEFGMNRIYYTPYASGQGNYYIHPLLAEYATNGSGYGRFAAALENLPNCQTETDMLHNMESAMWKNEILSPGVLGYSDFETDVNKRRTTPKEEMQSGFEKKLAPLKPAALEYYNGNETPLRDNASVWTTSLNFGVNCHTKHLILRLWEKDSVMIEYQW